MAAGLGSGHVTGSLFGKYSATYGLLGTVIVLLLWMYVTSLVILLGGEVASEMERA